MTKRKRICTLLLAVCILASLVFGTVFTGEMAARAKAGQGITSVSVKAGKKDVTKKTVTLRQGETAQLAVKAKPAKLKTSVAYSTSNKSVATVNKTGTVRAEGPGTARIKIAVSAGSKKKTTWVKIKVVQDTIDDNTASSGGKVLVAYFSRTGENYGVGVIQKGNTAVIADMIAEQTNGAEFEVVTAHPYPDDYSGCTAVARQEQQQNARPALKGALPALDEYDTIFVGYPIWYGDMPMAVYTFLESCNWNGKTVIPFCTHAGSGLSGTVASIRSICAGAEVKSGFAIAGTTAQNDRQTAKQSVSEWLSGLGF